MTFAVCYCALALVTAPSLHALDSGELAAAGVRLGLSHPPGQPLYMLLVRAGALVPLGDLGLRANLVSTLGAALAAALLAATARRHGVAPAVAAALGLAVAWSGPAVENATRAEVYTPGLAAVAAALLAAHTPAGGARQGGPRDDRRGVAAAGLVAGLALSLHPAAGIAIGLAHLARGGDRGALGGHVRFALGALVGVLPLAYVLVRGGRDPQPLWDAPGSIQEAIAFWTGSGFASAGPGDPSARWTWERLRREARGDETAEEGIRSVLLRISAVLAAQGEPRAAARALLVGLPGASAVLRRSASALPVRATLRADPPDAVLHERFGPDPGALVRALARLAWRAGRAEEATRLLEADGSDEATLQRGLLALTEGRQGEAQQLLRALIREHPEIADAVLRAAGGALGR